MTKCDQLGAAAVDDELLASLEGRIELLQAQVSDEAASTEVVRCCRRPKFLTVCKEDAPRWRDAHMWRDGPMCKLEIHVHLI